MNGVPKTYEARMRLVERQSASAYRHPVESMEPDIRDEIIEQFRELLAPIFLFIASGRDTRTRGMRSWAVLYVVRLDLLEGETIQHRARCDGVSTARIQALVNEFRRMVPDFHTRQQKPTGTVERMRVAHRRRAEVKYPGKTTQGLGRTTHPPGRESPLSGRPQTGSADAPDSTTRRP